MWEFYNPNPAARNVGDCAIRAIAKALGINWEESFALLAKSAFVMCDTPCSGGSAGAVLRQNGFRKAVVPDTCPDCYILETFVKEHPHGTYVIFTGNHVVTAVNGVYYDTWDSGNEIPIYYWYKED